MLRAMVIELQPERLLRLPGRAHARLVCLAGALWITEDAGTRDIVLEQGMSHLLSGGGAIVQAVRFSRLRIDPADARVAAPTLQLA